MGNVCNSYVSWWDTSIGMPCSKNDNSKNAFLVRMRTLKQVLKCGLDCLFNCFRHYMALSSFLKGNFSNLKSRWHMKMKYNNVKYNMFVWTKLLTKKIETFLNWIFWKMCNMVRSSLTKCAKIQHFERWPIKCDATMATNNKNCPFKRWFPTLMMLLAGTHKQLSQKVSF